MSMDAEEKETTKAALPDPPLAPIIETGDQDEDATMNVGEPSKGTVERIEEAQQTEDLAAGLSEGRPGQTRGIETTTTNASSDHEGSCEAETKGGSNAYGLHAGQPAGDAEDDRFSSPSAQEE